MSVASKILRFVDRKISRWPGQDTALALRTLRKNNIKLTLNGKPLNGVYGRLGLEIRLLKDVFSSDRIAAAFDVAWTIKNLAGKDNLEHIKNIGARKIDIAELAIWSTSIYNAFQRLPLNNSSGDLFIMNEEIMSSFFAFANSAKNREEKAFVLLVLNEAMGKHDPKTVLHGMRAQKLFTVLAGKMGLPPGMIKRTKRPAYLHDIGKLGVAYEMLHLVNMTKKERELIRKIHVSAGIRLLENIQWLSPHEIKIILFHHHNRNYPPKIRHANVPAEAKVLAVADSFDAMVKRAHKTPEKTIKILKKKSDHFYQPAVRAIEHAYRSGKLSKIDPLFDPRYWKALGNKAPGGTNPI